MLTTESANKVLGARLVQIFGGRLREWGDELHRRSDTIVAISRRGPRLIEYMMREGFLSESVLSRVISEQALPFLTRNNNGGFIVIDDAITYGTTFFNAVKLTKKAQIRCGGDVSKVTGIPFAVGRKANPSYKELAEKYFLKLDPDQIVPLVNNEMLAFRLLGKPYDIDYPMLTWIGDFSDIFELENALDRFTISLCGQKTEIDTLVPTIEGNVPIRRWTILLPANSHINICPHADFVKLRIYLNPEKDRLVVAGIQPVSLSKEDMNILGNILPAPLNDIWNEIGGTIDPNADEEMEKAGGCSLATLANFLLAMILLRDIKSAFLEAFETSIPQMYMLGPRSEDLQYLIGPALCSRAESALAQFLESKDSTPVSYPLFDHSAEIKNETFPSLYAKDYEDKIKEQISKAQNVYEVLQAIFCTQHSDIELKSRGVNVDNNNSKRLEFGITYGRLCQLIMEKFPNAPKIEIHECLDRLIDNGAIVPRYLNMASSDNSVIWAGTFRAGENAVYRAWHMIRLLFEKLSEAYGKAEVPPLLLEKYFTLALCVAVDVGVLLPLQSSDIKLKKLFHLYGARTGVKFEQETEFLTEWAVSQNILTRSKTSGFSEDDDTCNYRLNKKINTFCPKEECPWDHKVGDGLEDLAALVVAINEKLKGNALVALTSTASKRELQYALEAELQLWLYDKSASVYKGIAELDQLVENMSVNPPTKEQLKNVNNVLSNTANFTAQVKKKLDMEKKLDETYDMITEVAAAKTRTKRFWRDIRFTLEGRVSNESASPGLSEITSTLRIAHTATRILRELLTMAGFTSDRSIGLEQSLDLLQAVLDNPDMVDPITRSMFTDIDLKKDITQLITIAKSQPMDNLLEAFPAVRKLIMEIAARCEKVLKTHGIDHKSEPSEIIPQPYYVMMWDIIGSTSVETRNKLEAAIVDVNKRIKDTFGTQIIGFNADSKDDSNSFACRNFEVVLTVFKLLNDYFYDYKFRAGCDVNVLGELIYYPKSKTLGGRCHEYTARLRDFFKEVNKDTSLWSGKPVPDNLINASYMVVGEFAERYAKNEKTWPKDNTYKIDKLDGTYNSRVSDSIPISLLIIQPAAKSKNKTVELPGQQQELM